MNPIDPIKGIGGMGKRFPKKIVKSVDKKLPIPSPTFKGILDKARKEREKLGMDLREFAKWAVESSAKFMREGNSNEKDAPKKYDTKQLAMGQKIEMEHTKDPKVALKISKDHETEFPGRYYTALKKMEKKLEAKQGG